MPLFSKKGGNLDTDTPTERTPCGHEGKDQGDASTCQEMPTMASKAVGARRGMEQICYGSQKEPNLPTP